MTDIEMMGDGHNAVICSIAACPFTRLGPAPGWEDVRRDGFDCAVRMQSGLNAGMIISGGTIEWWLKQSEAARMALLKDPKPLREALSLFRKYLMNLVEGDSKRLVIWAKPAAGDLVVLQTAYEAIGSIAPWLGKNRRCLSTLKGELAPAVPRWPSEDLPTDLRHVALWDVYGQILDAQAACAVLEKIRTTG